MINLNGTPTSGPVRIGSLTVIITHRSPLLPPNWLDDQLALLNGRVALSSSPNQSSESSPAARLALRQLTIRTGIRTLSTLPYPDLTFLFGPDSNSNDDEDNDKESSGGGGANDRDCRVQYPQRSLRQTVRSLTVQHMELKSISGIGAMGALAVLDVSHNRDLSTLQPLHYRCGQTLKQLNLHGCCGIHALDFGPEGLPLLEEVNLSTTGVRCLLPLAASRYTLRVLNVDGTPLTSLAPLDQLTKLERLEASRLWALAPDSIPALRAHPYLQYLSFNSSAVNSLAGVLCPADPAAAALTPLHTINLTGLSALSSLAPLRAFCGALRVLQLGSCTHIASLSDLDQHLPNLEQADLYGTDIDSILPLRHCHRLRRINVCDCRRLCDISEALSGKQCLEIVLANNTGITTRQQLVDCPALRDVFGCKWSRGGLCVVS